MLVGVPEAVEEKADLNGVVAARLRRADQRYTPTRRGLVEVLETSGRPLSIPDILALRPGMPQSTVYRNLAVLEQAGTVRRVIAAGGFAHYELSEDLTEHHHHLICTLCRKVTDVTMSPRLERSLERAVAEVAMEADFRLEGHRLDLLGRCTGCA
ncbi:MAG: Fur family transcriptional regulator [Acidimicrobiia bacterium]